MNRMTNFNKENKDEEFKKNEFLDDYFNREKQAEKDKKNEEIKRSRDWIKQHNRNGSKSFISAAGIIIILVSFVGCTSTSKPSNNFDWNNPEDVGNFIEWQSKNQEKRHFDDY